MVTRVRWDRIAAMRTVLLVVLGLAAVVTGVWMFCVPAGVITLGVALLVLAYLTDDSNDKEVLT